jgi:hypothetical protein
MKKLVLFAVIFIAFTATTFGQAEATATAAATIVGPIGISNTANMNFGNVAVSATLAGTVLMDPDGTRTPGGGCTLPATTGTVSGAAFLVTGVTGYGFSITLPAAATTLSDGAGHNMTVDAWTSNPSGTGSIVAGGTTLQVGATLNVGAGQTPGLYNSTAPFTVTVNYN